MKTKKERVIPFYVRAICPECGKELQMGDTVLMTYPAQYCYSCENCGFTTTSTEKFPHLEYEREGND